MVERPKHHFKAAAQLAVFASRAHKKEVAEKGKKGVVQPAVSRDTDEAMGGG